MEPGKAVPKPTQGPPAGQPASALHAWMAGLVGVVAILLLLSILVS